MSDASLDKAGLHRAARMASGGIARAVDPVFSDVDGDVVFFLASGQQTSDRFDALAVGTVAATLTAAAIRDAVRSQPPPSASSRSFSGSAGTALRSERPIIKT